MTQELNVAEKATVARFGLDRPERIQLRRTKGWRLPANSVVVSRPSKWGNPFPVDYTTADGYTAAEAVAKYRIWIEGRIRDGHLNIAELRGKNLACWCSVDKPMPCHADVLLELASREVIA